MKLSEVRKLVNGYLTSFDGKLNHNCSVEEVGKFVIEKVEGFITGEIVDLYLVKEKSKKYLAVLIWLGNVYGVAGLYDFNFTVESAIVNSGEGGLRL